MQELCLLLCTLYWSARWMMERGKRCYVDKDWEIGRASEGIYCSEGHSSLKPKGGVRDLLLWGRSYLENSCIMSEA